MASRVWPRLAEEPVSTWMPAFFWAASESDIWVTLLASWAGPSVAGRAAAEMDCGSFLHPERAARSVRPERMARVFRWGFTGAVLVRVSD